jgi:hypothetical protein
MKTAQKLILPALIILIFFLIYTIYFAKEGLGSFSDFDTNNTANKDIIVAVAKDRAIQQDAASGSAMFYAVDKNGVVVSIQAPYPLPNGIESAENVSLKGHLHKEYFHAVEVKLR